MQELDKHKDGTAIDIAVRLGLFALLAYWSFAIVAPFLTILIWSAILAVALYPIYRWLERWLNSPKFAAALATLPCIFVVLAPMAWLGFGLLNGVDIVTKKLEGGWSIPLPPASIKEWPVIGGQVYRI